MELVSGDRMGRQDWHQANRQHVHQSVSHHFIKSSCSGLTPTLCPAPWGGPSFPWLRVSAPPSPRRPGSEGGWDGPGWNVWSWWENMGTGPPPCPHWGSLAQPQPQASLSVPTGKEGMVTMVTGLSTVWPTSWGWCTT